MKVTPIKPTMRSSDKDERGDSERKRLNLLLALLEGMSIPKGRINLIWNEESRFHSLKWLDRNIAVQNRDHRNFVQARNLLTLILKSEHKKRQ